MEDISKAPHSMGSGQSHTINHTRPFFYVQPPSQPYYMCPWQMNSPFGHYPLPGSGIPFGRPYWALYPYMQYPGYIMPHAPIQPIDYRRMFSPPFSPTATYDVRFRHQYHHQSRVRRETACSEVQTDPSDLVNELIESFSKFRSFTAASETEKKLDSSMVPQVSGGCMHSGHGDVRVEPMVGLQPLPQRQKHTRSLSPIPASLMESIVTECDIDLRQSPHEDLPPKGWSVGSEASPLDSSSLHEETIEGDGELEQSYTPEKLADTLATESLSGVMRAQPDCDMCPTDSVSSQDSDPAQVGSPRAMSPVSQGSFEKSNQKTKTPQAAEGRDFLEKPTLDTEDLPYRILRLPCDKVAAVGMLQKASPLWCMDPPLMTPSSYLSTFGNALYYSYYPQTAQERQSVLSPSLDELSSRDELFSTDLEDMDLGQPYISGGRVLKDAREMLLHADGDLPDCTFQEHCPVCPKRTCSVCGMHLSKEAQRRGAAGLGSCSNPERRKTDEGIEEDEDDDDEMKSATGPQKAQISKHCVRRCSQTSARQLPKLKYKQGYCDDAKDHGNLEHQDHDCLREPQCCEEHKVLAKAKKSRDHESGCALSRLCPDKQRREEPDFSDQEGWEASSLKHRPKSGKLYSSRGEAERPMRRRTPCKAEHQRAIRNDYDEPDDENPLQLKGRGSIRRCSRRC